MYGRWRGTQETPRTWCSVWVGVLSDDANAHRHHAQRAVVATQHRRRFAAARDACDTNDMVRAIPFAYRCRRKMLRHRRQLNAALVE